MRLWIAFTLVVCLCGARSAQAGPWLREKGSTFTSVSITATYFRDMGNAAYMEHGLTDKMTIGTDVGRFAGRDGKQSGFATLFLRRALGSNKGKNRWAYELGVGSAWVGELMLPHVKTGVSWGRGFEMWDKNGWMTVDASALWGISHDQHSVKVDATLGLNFTEVTTGMVQVYLAHLDNAFFATLAPSVVIKPRKAKFKIQIGTEIPVNDTKNTAIKLGIWREF